MVLPLSRTCLVLIAGLLFAFCGPAASPTDDGNLGDVQRFEVAILNEVLYAEVQPLEVIAPSGESDKRRVRCEVRLLRKDGSRAGVARTAGNGARGDRRSQSTDWTGEIGEGETGQMAFFSLTVDEGVPAPLNCVNLRLSPVFGGPRQVTFTLESEAICIR